MVKTEAALDMSHLLGKKQSRSLSLSGRLKTPRLLAVTSHSSSLSTLTPRAGTPSTAV
jgi:hypothetical protein